MNDVLITKHRHHWCYLHAVWQGRTPNSAGVVRYCECGKAEAGFVSRWGDIPGSHPDMTDELKRDHIAHLQARVCELETHLAEAADVCTAADELAHQHRRRIRELESKLLTIEEILERKIFGTEALRG